MTATPLAEKARSGDIDAITELINRSLHKHRITATTRLEAGVLEVMLDHSVPPNESIATFIHNGLAKLNISNVYETIIYGRQAGELFATWSHTFELKPRPIDSLLNPISSRRSSAEEDGERTLVVTFASEGGHITRINDAQRIGFLGVGLLMFGTFCPIISLPFKGTLSYYHTEPQAGIMLLGLSLVSVICLIKKQSSWLYGTGLWLLLLVIGPFLHYQGKLTQIKAEAARELAGNPFRRLADLAIESAELQWGWVVLFLGVSLVLSAAYLQKRKLDRQTVAATGIVFFGMLLLVHIYQIILLINLLIT